MIEDLTALETMKRALVQYLRNLVARVSPVSDVHWEIEVHSTDFFPFRAYASATHGADPCAEEALVIGLQCHRPGGVSGQMLVLYADISSEDGTVLAESPRYELELTQSADALAARDATAVLERRTDNTVRALEQWLEGQLPLIGQTLSDARRS